MTSTEQRLLEVPTDSIKPNPLNPRRFFNEARLNLLRSSIQEVGILVPLIVYRDPAEQGRYILLDGERRLISAHDIGLETVPISVTDEPTDVENVLRMFNIHSVREDWSLVSVALSLKQVMGVTNERRETELSLMTGLTRSAVRRAKRILELPEEEIERISLEAHLPRNEQIHREDLYLEVAAAESVLRTTFPEIAEEFTRERIIRQFVLKRELNHLVSVTDFRQISKIAQASKSDLVPRLEVLAAVRRLILDPSLNPSTVFEELLAASYQQQSIQRKTRTLSTDLESLGLADEISDDLLDSLKSLRESIDRLLSSRK